MDHLRSDHFNDFADVSAATGVVQTRSSLCAVATRFAVFDGTDLSIPVRRYQCTVDNGSLHVVCWCTCSMDVAAADNPSCFCA